MFLGLELGSWAEWVTGIGSILAISAGFFYRKHDKKLQIRIKGYLYHFRKQVKFPENQNSTSQDNVSVDKESSYFKINVRNIGEMDTKILEAGITNKYFTYEDIWQDVKEKKYALYTFKTNKEIVGKTALPLNMPWVEKDLGQTISKKSARKLKVYAIDELDNIYYGKLKFVDDITERVKQ